MATQSITFSASNLPAAGTFIQSAQVNTTLLALINDYNLLVGNNKMALNSVTASIFTAEAWTTWASAATGFTGALSADANTYIQYGKVVFIRFNISGTSNATTFAVTLPVAAKIGQDSFFRFTNNGTVSATPGMIDYTASSTTANFYTDWTGAGWNAAGTKGANGYAFYEAL